MSQGTTVQVNPSAIPPRHIRFIVEQPLPLIRLLRWPRKIKTAIITRTSKEYFSFLQLPFEIRDQIYRYALVFPEPIQISSTPRASETTEALVDAVHSRTRRRAYRKGMAVNLLQTCHWINQEAAPILYGLNRFEPSSSTGSWLRLDRFLAQIGPSNARHLNNLYILPPSKEFPLRLRPKVRGTVMGLAQSCARLPRWVTLGFAEDILELFKVQYSDADVFESACRRLIDVDRMAALHFNDEILRTALFRPLLLKRSLGFKVSGTSFKTMIETDIYKLDDEENLTEPQRPLYTDVWISNMPVRGILTPALMVELLLARHF